MAIDIIGTGQPEGTSLGKSTTELVGLYGVVKAQAAHIADATTVATNESDATELAPVLDGLVDKFNVLLDDLSDIGIIASA